MFIFDSSVERVVTRNKALGYKSLVIADEVNNGDEVTMTMSDGKILVSPVAVSEEPQSDSNAEPEMTLLLKEFGLIDDFETTLEITLCDNYMLVTIVEGAVDINLDGNVMMASRGIDTSRIARHDLSKVSWVGVTQLLSYCQFWSGANEQYPYDYIYMVKAKKDRSSNTTAFSPVDINAFLYDISNGQLAVKEQERVKKEQLAVQVEQAKSLYESFYASRGSYTDEYAVDDVEDDYDEDEFSDDDTDIYDY